MARGDALNRQLIARIASSVVSLVVHYPPVRPVVVSPPTHVSPLTGPIPAATLVPVPPTLSHPTITMKCLWLDTPNTGRLEPSKPALQIKTAGWVEGAEALARVAVADPSCGAHAALDPTHPYAGTVFDACVDVEVNGKRYRVLQLDPVGHSFSPPVTYSLWLKGARKD